MKKKYIKPIIEYCPLESDIMAGSLEANSTKVGDSEEKLYDVPTENGVHAPTESKENFWNLWEDDDMEFEF